MNEKRQKLVAVVGLIGVIGVFGYLATARSDNSQEYANRTSQTVEERIGDCETHACIVKAGEAFPSLCHLKVAGTFTYGVVECDDDCKWLRRSDSVFDCWRVETCNQDPECARKFNLR